MPQDLLDLINEDVRPSHCHTHVEEEFDVIDLDDYQTYHSAQLHEESYAYR